MHYKGPQLEDIKRCIRADAVALVIHGYTAEDILKCLKAYHARRDTYRKAIAAFEAEVRDPVKGIPLLIHSIASRTKDPLHLIAKLVRKRLETNGRSITEDNFFKPDEGVTDLGGVRILHTYKYQWKKIHRYLHEKTLKCCKLHEQQAYVRSDEDRDEYIDKKPLNGFQAHEVSVREDTNYTSLHYIFKYKNDIYFECQVRTLFEEGWAEINHQRQYPSGATEVEGSQLALLNKAASMADNIASSFQRLDSLPIFIPWEAELWHERAATSVSVISRDLRWPASHLSELIDQLHKSSTKYEYIIPRPNRDRKHRALINNKKKIDEVLRLNGFSGSRRLQFVSINPEHFQVPIFSDILLLRNTLNPRTWEDRDFIVVGTPTRPNSDPAQRLDMLIEDRQHVALLGKFIRKVRRNRSVR